MMSRSNVALTSLQVEYFSPPYTVTDFLYLLGKLLLGDVVKELYYWDVHKEIEDVVKKIDNQAK
jgi:hypothetical protein